MKKQDNQREVALCAYLAGIIDGEGTIRIGGAKCNEKNRNTRYYASISVGMTDKAVIQLLVETFGSKMRIERVRIPNRKDVYRWGTSGNIAVPRIIEKLLPYLIIKKQQAELVLQFCIKGKKEEKSCRICKSKKIQGYSLCSRCYHSIWKKGEMDKWKIISAKCLSGNELQRREEFYLKVKKLNAVGTPATTKRDDTREGEAIV